MLGRGGQHRWPRAGASGTALRTQREAWHARSDAPPAVLLRGLQAWTRLHEVPSLELDGHLAAAGVDPALLYQAERTSWSVR
ncbi:MAG: hypothetical protein ACLPQY_33070 [Streptosporangiaceae bacterium]